MCAFREAVETAAEQGGLRESLTRTNAAPPVKQVDVRTACPCWLPPHQSHFPKAAVTHDAESPAVSVTLLVKGIMARRLTFLFQGIEVRAAGGELDEISFYGCDSVTGSSSVLTVPSPPRCLSSVSTSVSPAASPPQTSPLAHIHTCRGVSAKTFPSVFPPVSGRACPDVLGTLTVSEC